MKRFFKNTIALARYLATTDDAVADLQETSRRANTLKRLGKRVDSIDSAVMELVDLPGQVAEQVKELRQRLDDAACGDDLTALAATVDEIDRTYVTGDRLDDLDLESMVKSELEDIDLEDYIDTDKLDLDINISDLCDEQTPDLSEHINIDRIADAIAESLTVTRKSEIML